MNSGEYAVSLLQRGHSIQDVSVICGLPSERVRLLSANRPKRETFELKNPPQPVAPVLPPYGPPKPTKGMMIMGSIEALARRHGLTKEDLIGQNRARRIAWPRQEAMHMLRHRWGLSLPRIGQLLGGRHHTTVLDGIRKHEMRMPREIGC